MFCEEGEINKALFIRQKQTPRFNNLKSILRNKNYELNNDDESLKILLPLLFSDQAGISYLTSDKQANTFYNLICNNELYFSEFNNYQKASINYLIEKNIITLEDNKLFLLYKQRLRLVVYKELYDFGSISELGFLEQVNEKHRQDVLSMIPKMLEDDVLVPRSLLYTKKEADYLDYILNNLKFDNALAIRNKYGHGSVVDNNLEDYLYTILVLIHFALKIDQELVNKANLTKK